MTTLAPARSDVVALTIAENGFRVGRVISRAATVLSRNFMTFFIVSAVAYLPTLLLNMAQPGYGAWLYSLTFPIGQAVIVHAAFQDTYGRPIHLGESLGVGLARLLPIIGLVVITAILGGIGFLLLVIPGLILMTMWFVSMPACVAEQLGPITSLSRSTELTEGHRWQIFGLMILLFIINAVITDVIGIGFAALGGTLLAMISDLIWNGFWGALYATVVVTAYHDLRVAKEGHGIGRLATVFD
jgi:hypothetical protein